MDFCPALKASPAICRRWATGMVPPAANALREAEEWLELLQPQRSTNLLEGLKARDVVGSVLVSLVAARRFCPPPPSPGGSLAYYGTGNV